MPARYTSAGQVWREYTIAPYTARLATLAHPEQLLVDWILKSTGAETWHGEEIAVLTASRGKLRVLHRPEVQDRVAELVERFVHPVQFQVSMRIQFVSSSDLDWRSGLVHLMKPVASGPQGQQVWLLPAEDVALIRHRLQLDSQSRLLSEHQILTHNGEPATAETSQSVNYISGVELATGAFQAYRPMVGRLHEGAKLIINPLWATDGSGADIEFKLATQVLNKLHYSQNAAPLSTGNQQTVIQVPQMAATSFEQTVFWPTSQVLLISAGVHQGMLGAKRGVFSLAAPAAELLVLAELHPAVRTAPEPAHEDASEALLPRPRR